MKHRLVALLPLPDQAEVFTAYSGGQITTNQILNLLALIR